MNQYFHQWFGQLTWRGVWWLDQLVSEGWQRWSHPERNNGRILDGLGSERQFERPFSLIDQQHVDLKSISLETHPV